MYVTLAEEENFYGMTFRIASSQVKWTTRATTKEIRENANDYKWKEASV